MRSFLPFLLLFSWAVAASGQPISSLTPAQAQALVERALTTELRAAQDSNHPMRYRLRKSSPRLTSTKEIVETRDGAVAHLIAINDKPLSPADAQKEEERLDALLADPGRQQHRKQGEKQDSGRAWKVLRALPEAFLYQYAGAAAEASGPVEKFTFRPNPKYIPPDLETQALAAMTGELWIDAAQKRVTRLEGHVQRDVDVGWGILARLDKGGWIVIEQSDVGGHQWRITRFQMVMSGRVLFKNKRFDTVEDETRFEPVAAMDYRQAIQLLRSSAETSAARSLTE
jgi:hypothetical protein